MTDATTPAVSPPEIRRHVEGANPAVLLASLVAITGETSKIAEFKPHFSYGIDMTGVTSELPADLRAELDAWGVEVITNLERYANRNPLEVADEAFKALLEAMVGFPIETHSLPFLREQGGFVSFVPTVPRTKPVRPGFKLAIVGAGMAGIAMAIAAKAAGIDFVVLEKKDGLGGVWWQNRYPGVGVDTPSKYYSFSFEINPEWTHAFPEGGQYLRYLDRVARKYGVIDNFTFGADVSELVWDEGSASWQIAYTKDGRREEITANAVVTAAGYLTNPQLPAVPGIQSFNGEWFHSANWNQNYDFAGKKVAVVGTGCTSVQIVDALAPLIDGLVLFQRQPHWVMPSAGRTGLPEAERWLLLNVPTFAAFARLHTFIPIGDANYETVRYDEAWAAEHEFSISPRNDIGLQAALWHLDESLADRPDLKKALTPNFAFMGKRPVRDPGAYFETLKRDSTTLVTSGLSEVTPQGPVDAEGNLHEVDAIIYATGFTLEYLSSWTIVGRQGQKLNELWGETPVAYLGCQVPGFPNLFVTSGPNASAAHGGGHNFTVEAVVHYVIECLQTLFEKDAATMDVKPEALEDWVEEVRALLAGSIWMREKRATTYYRNARGEVTLASPLLMEEYWTRLREPNLEHLIVE